MFRKNKYFISSIVVLLFLSCEKRIEVGKTKTESISGEFIVKMDKHDKDGKISSILDKSTDFLYISNTSENVENKIIIVYKYLKARANSNLNNLTFEFAGKQDDTTNWEEPIKELKGKLIKNGSKKLPSKIISDSLYIEFINISDALKYTISGYRRTGFVEDETF